jgi:hypothetical protein
MAAFAAIHGAYPLGREGRYMDEELQSLDLDYDERWSA